MLNENSEQSIVISLSLDMSSRIKKVTWLIRWTFDLIETIYYVVSNFRDYICLTDINKYVE
jgi:hypothetical protein